MTWFCIAVKKPSVSANKSALVSHFFDASISTCCWPRSYGCRPCKAIIIIIIICCHIYAGCLQLHTWKTPCFWST